MGQSFILLTVRDFQGDFQTERPGQTKCPGLCLRCAGIVAAVVGILPACGSCYLRLFSPSDAGCLPMANAGSQAVHKVGYSASGIPAFFQKAA